MRLTAARILGGCDPARTSRPVLASLSQSAFSSVLFPEPGGPSSSVRRPGFSVPLQPSRMCSSCCFVRIKPTFLKNACGCARPYSERPHHKSASSYIEPTSHRIGCAMGPGCDPSDNLGSVTKCRCCRLERHGSHRTLNGVHVLRRLVQGAINGCNSSGGAGKHVRKSAYRLRRPKIHLHGVAVRVPDGRQRAAGALCVRRHPEVLETDFDLVQLDADPAAARYHGRSQDSGQLQAQLFVNDTKNW